MKKALIVTTVASTIDQFLMPSICVLVNLGYRVDVACNFENGSTCNLTQIELLKNKFDTMNVKCLHICFSRSVTNIIDNYNAYKKLLNIIKNEKYSLVHCHTPIAAMCTRLACRSVRKKGTKVIYTAHGFHFYKGAPLKNWLIYYPVEKFCSHFTDVLITINNEDYELASKKMKAKKVVYVPGVGIDLEKFSQCTVDINEKRKELGIPENAFVLLSVGELNHNKNHEAVIKAIKNKDVYYLIAGKGGLQEYLQNEIDDCGLNGRVKLLGFRTDIKELLSVADVFVFPSYREGLSVALMEAMANGKPCVVSKIRGNVDLIDEGKGGFLCSPGDSAAFAQAIEKLAADENLRNRMGEYNKQRIKDFDLAVVNEMVKSIYQSVLKD